MPENQNEPRKCFKCGEVEIDPGGILCGECKSLMETSISL